MGGFFGITATQECLTDVFFGVDYHSHLGTRRGGLAAYDPLIGLQRKIHNIENAPFRTKFEHITQEMSGTAAIGCISDTDPQPLLIRSNLGSYALCTVGIINNSDELIDRYLSFSGGHFDAMTGGRVNSTELMAALINQKSDFADGIRFAQKSIDGTACVLILTQTGTVIAARDRMGRLPVHIGKREDGYAVSMEPFAFAKLGFEEVRELCPGEIVELTPQGMKQLAKPGARKCICSFLWTYYGYPTSAYEGVNVEMMRYRNGAMLAEQDRQAGCLEDVDYVAAMPDSGIPYAIGYSNECHKPYARAFVKYTPTWSRSFMPVDQSERNRVAKMKQLPNSDVIRDKSLLFVDDSIVRGTQLRETVEFLMENGAKAVHMRSACPPIMYACKFLNFSRSTSDDDLLARKIIEELEGPEGLEHLEEYSDGTTERGKKMRRAIADKFGFDSLEFQSLENVIRSIGLSECDLCTYCWNGKE